MEQGEFISPFAYEWFVEAEISAAKGNHDDAAIALETAKAAPSEDALLMARLAEEYEMSGASRRADRALAAARRADPASARVLTAEGRIHEHRGELDDAIRAFVEASAIDPSSEEAVLALAETLRGRGLALRANEVLIGYVQRHRNHRHDGVRHALLDLARTHADAEALRRTLSLAVGRDPARAALLAAELAYETGQPALAARLLEGSLGTNRGLGLWLRSLVESGDRDLARNALARTPSRSVGGPVKHAELLLEVEARELALKVLQSEEPTPQVLYLRGRALLEQGEYVSAARALAAVPVGSSTFEDARLALAQSADARGRAGAAAESLSVTPVDAPEIRRKLAELQVSKGELRRGLRLFDPKRQRDRASIARLFEQAGHYQEAAAYYATVEPSADEAPSVHARAAAERLMSRGLTRSAATVLEHWTAAAPTDLHARVRLVEILLLLDESGAAKEEGQNALPFIEDPQLRVHLEALLARIDR